MKRIVELLLVFCFAVCMATPTVHASVFDDDVGVTIDQGVAFTQGVFVTDLPETATPAVAHLMIPQSECPFSDFQFQAHACLIEKPTLNSYWHEGDSKASRCEAKGGIYTAFYNDTTALRYAHLRLWPPRS